MFAKRSKLRNEPEPVDGGEGKGVPLGGRDSRPPTGYQQETSIDELEGLWDDDNAAERRRDPLRQ